MIGNTPDHLQYGTNGFSIRFQFLDSGGGPLYLIGLRHAWLEVLGPSAIGLLALGLAALSIGAATAVRARGPEAKGARRVAMVWLTASAAGFVTLAIPLQLSNEWITVGWALEALALTALWRRFDHTGLKYLALGLGSAQAGAPPP